jgi:SAM-dependent methyltransferase
MDWFVRDFDHPAYFEIYADKEKDAEREGTALAAYLDVPPQSLVLDLPCGWGRLHPYWLSRGWKHIGGDLSVLNLKKHAELHPSDLVRLDMRNLPFKNSIADAVICAFTSWGYFLDDDENMRHLEEYARVLKPGAPLILDLVGRHHLEKSTSLLEDFWYDVKDGNYKERIRWTQDKARIITDRIKNGHRFQHNLWVPTDSEIRTALSSAGFEVHKCWGGLDGEPWHEMAERCVYRAVAMKEHRAAK